MLFDVAYAAGIQVDQLNADEKAELERLFADPHPKAIKLAPHRPDGCFVSRLSDKRVLWHRRNTGKPEILSIVDRSYAA